MIIWFQYYILLGTCFALLVTIVASKEPDHRGTRFVIGFMENNSTLPPKILVIPQLETEVNVTVTVTMPRNTTFTPRSVTVRQNEATTIELPVWVRMPVPTVGNKGIQVEATSDIVVYGVNRANGSSEAFLALPADDALGQDYMLASYKETGDFISQAGIIATEPNTTILVHIPDAIDHNGEIRVGPTVISETRFHNVTLDAFQTLQLESFFDLTGINITSDKPITVISGNTARANATDRDFLCDHFSEQLSPTRSWGRSFATVPFSVGKTDDVFQVIAKHNDTEVNITQRLTNKSYHLDESEHVEVNVGKGDYISIEADKPVLVLQYVVPNMIQGGGGGGGREDCHHSSCGSFMLMVPPMEQQEHQYLFSTLNVNWKQNVNVVISSNLTGGVLLDGEAILNSANVTNYKELPSWTVIDTHSEINYSAIQFSVDGGLHNLSHHYPDAVFAATSSDGHALGMLQKILYEVHVEYNINNNDTYQLNRDGGDGVSDEEEDLEKKYQNRSRDEGLSHSVIAVIVSLCSGIFFVIVCIVGFIIAEFFCNGKEPSIFTRAKITPFNN